MVSKLIKKIWVICLWLASLALVGCFHVPDEDWLPSKNKVETWNIQENNEIDQAFDSFINDFNNISNQRDEMKNNENTPSEIDESYETEDETIDVEDKNNDANTNQEAEAPVVQE